MNSGRKIDPTDLSNDAPLSSTPRGLSVAGLVLWVLFAIIFSGVFFPLRLLDPAWQLRVGSVLIDSSPIPLIGLGLFHLAAELDPYDTILNGRRKLASKFASAISQGYLLLIPLLIFAAVRDQQHQSNDYIAKVHRANAQLEQLRQITSTAETVSDLEQRLLALQGPTLDQADRSQPLPVLRNRVNALLDRAASEVARSKTSAPSSNPLSLLPEITRSTVASLGLAVGFAGLSCIPGSEISLLEQLQNSFSRLRLRRQLKRRSRSSNFGDQEYIRLISEEQD